MHNLTVTELELRRLLAFFAYMVGVVCAIWIAVVLLVSTQAPGLVDFVRAFFGAVAVSTFALPFLYGASWRWNVLGTWLGRPPVHGVWCGTLISDYKSKEGVELHVPIVFVIRQTYLSLSLKSYTPDQLGTSDLEGLVHDQRSGETRLRYMFGLERLYKNENKLTKGAGELRLHTGATALHGFYWTSTPTHGELRLKFVSRECEDVDSFEVARQRWPRDLAADSKELAVGQIARTAAVRSQTA
jgi:hypothetical protein